MKTVICPGSFDPVTNGHLDIIQRCSKMFDKVIVLVAVNVDKHYSFTPEERAAMLNKCVAGMDNVQVETFDGLLVDYVRETGADAVVKGLRAVSDFEYEFQMAMTNRKLYHGCETIFMTPNYKYLYLSSSIVRQVGSMGGDISDFVPSVVLDEIIARINRRKQD